MGYRTNYQLMTMTRVLRRDLLAAIPDDRMDESAKKMLDRMEGLWCKWYEHEEDIAIAMLATGAQDVVLFGVGEDYPGDVWHKQFVREADGGISVTKHMWSVTSFDPPRRVTPH